MRVGVRAVFVSGGMATREGVLRKRSPALLKGYEKRRVVLGGGGKECLALSLKRHARPVEPSGKVERR